MSLSYAKFYKPLMRAARIPDGAKIVFCALQDFCEWKANLKIDTLAKATGKSRRTIFRELEWLREKRLIEIRWRQRESEYRIAPNWEALIRHIETSDVPTVAHQKTKSGTSGVSEVAHQNPAAPYLLQDSISRHEDCVKTSKLSTREETADAHAAVLVKSSGPDLVGTLAQCREIYRKAGRPFSPKNEQLALQLLISLSPDEQARAAQRLPNYLKWAVLSLWSDPQHTKSLLNVLRDGDWDVELARRDVPAPRKLTLAEQQKQLYFARAQAKAAQR